VAILRRCRQFWPVAGACQWIAFSSHIPKSVSPGLLQREMNFVGRAGRSAAANRKTDEFRGFLRDSSLYATEARFALPHNQFKGRQAQVATSTPPGDLWCGFSIHLVMGSGVPAKTHARINRARSMPNHSWYWRPWPARKLWPTMPSEPLEMIRQMQVAPALRVRTSTIAVPIRASVASDEKCCNSQVFRSTVDRQNGRRSAKVVESSTILHSRSDPNRKHGAFQE
jgi:hypothetical protein